MTHIIPFSLLLALVGCEENTASTNTGGSGPSLTEDVGPQGLTWEVSEDAELALVVLAGAESDSLPLFDVSDANDTVSVVFESPLLDGGTWTEEVAASDTVFTPPLLGLDVGSEHPFTVSVDGERLAIITVRVVSEAQFDLFGFVPEEAILRMGEVSALVDETLVQDLASNDGISAVVLSEDGAVPPPAVCIRVPWGPGKANWSSGTPGSGGQGFSYAPESSIALAWATPTYDDLDGVYRTSWGCTLMLKVANSCTATVSTTASISTCCNAAMMALGHTASFLNPSADSYFPDCPL